MNKFELVFIPAPWIGHLASTLEMANVLITRDPRLSVTVLLMQVSVDSKGIEYIQLLSSSFPTKSIHFILLPQLPLPEECQNGMPKQLIEIYKPHVREAIINHTNSQTAPDSPRLVGFVLDMFCMTMIEVAKEFKAPCYVFYTSSAAFLALNFHLQELYDQNQNNKVVEQLKNSESDLALPCFVNPLPGKSIPNIFVYNDVFIWMYENTRKLRTEIEGILINTCIEIESYTINSMTTRSSVSKLPRLYSVGPILNMKNIINKEPIKVNTMKWLDKQPPESVIYLSFGSMGSFDEDQVKEIAKGLEQSGVRFLWALRKPPKKGKLEAPSDYGDIIDALPDGFVERTANVGKIIGWAPQLDVLAHRATAGFVSHCGWNSVLESVWHGVPVAAWPMYAEQQLNGFEMVAELGLGVEIALDYGKDYRVGRSRVVMAEEIESGIGKLMNGGDEIRKRVKEKSRQVRGMGHLASTVEMANVLVRRDDCLAVTVLAIKLPYDAKIAEYIESLSTSFDGKSIRFIVLPEVPFSNECSSRRLMMKSLLEIYKPHVREVVTKLTNSQANPDSIRLIGFVIDMFCTAFIDVAKEFQVPCYLFYTSSAGFLALSFHLQELYHQNNKTEHLENSDVDLALSSFMNPIPSKVIPDIFFDKEMAVWFHDNANKFRTEIKGILINTFIEMESHILERMSNGSLNIPKLYPVGPILQQNNTQNGADVIKWLDDQPPASVVFLCFGSKGSFDEDQAKEIARALEKSEARFLWSLRRPPPKGKLEVPSDYAELNDVLPEGFLDRTKSVGRVIGWAPQVEILAHRATGGFVSHCGWNSTLESVWHGVPMATWPMYAEQKFNAFEMVVELGLAVEIRLDYRKDFQTERLRVVSAEEIESGIRQLMESGNEIRKKIKAKSQESQRSMMDGGSSFISLGHFIDDILATHQKSKK